MLVHSYMPLPWSIVRRKQHKVFVRKTLRCEKGYVVAQRNLQAWEMTAVGLRGAADQQYQHRVHQELAVNQAALTQQTRLDDVIRSGAPMASLCAQINA